MCTVEGMVCGTGEGVICVQRGGEYLFAHGSGCLWVQWRAGVCVKGVWII